MIFNPPKTPILLNLIPKAAIYKDLNYLAIF